MSQKTYIAKILERFNMRDCKPMDTPVVKGHHLSTDLCPKLESEVQHMKRVSYSSAIGSLMYAMLCTRPDMFRRWLGESIPIQPRSEELGSC